MEVDQLARGWVIVTPCDEVYLITSDVTQNGTHERGMSVVRLDHGEGEIDQTGVCKWWVSPVEFLLRCELFSPDEVFLTFNRRGV